MKALTIVKSAGSIFGLLVLAAVLFLARDRFAQKAVADAAERCAAATAKPVAPLGDCAPAIATSVNGQRRAALCDTALLHHAADTTARFVVLNACAAGVKRLFAERDTLNSRVDNLSAVLAEADARSTAAVARAEGRAATLNERNARVQSAIKAAPRDGAGRVTCDAECLRRIAQ